MNIANKKRSLVFFLGAAVYGAAVFAESASAQNVAAPTMSQSGSTAIAAIAAIPGVDSVSDEELGKSVQAALHADPYFYDEHVSVSVDNGAVVLHGYVSSDWDIRDAMRIARKAAGQRRVVDDLRINDPTIRQGR
jgi:osmotically-inducible protein OsmY